MQMINIRRFEANDAQPVEELLRTLWGHMPSMLAIYRVHRDWKNEAELVRQTLVATADGTVVGAGTLFESTFHPRMLMVVINVVQNWQRQGIGSALFDALMQLGDGRPWLAKLTRRDHAGVAFLDKRGFRPVLRTLTGLLDPRQPSVRAWMATLPTSTSEGRIFSFDDPNCTASLAEIALVHAAIYRQFHAWNPPVEEDAQRALIRYCGPNVIMGSQLCAYEGQRLVEAANLIANPFQPDSDEAYLVQVGVIGPQRPGRHTLTAALIRRSLEFAAAHGLRVRFEADDTFVPHWSLFGQAPATEVDRDLVIMASESAGI